MSQRALREAIARWRDEHGMRKDWHEPDEQGITASVVGSHLDNAFVASPTGELVESDHTEFHVILRDEEGRHLNINLASLLAAAAEGVETPDTLNKPAGEAETRTELTSVRENPTDFGPEWTLETVVPVETKKVTDRHQRYDRTSSEDIVQTLLWVWRRA